MSLFIQSLTLLVLIVIVFSLSIKVAQKRRWFWDMILRFLFMVGFSIPIHYLHIFDNQQWYYEYRSWNQVELLTALNISIIGLVYVRIQQKWIRSLSVIFLFILCILPFIKPWLSLLQNNHYQDRWSDGICLQSTPSSCGPASIASILKHYGERVSEAEIARQSYTYSGGTESWYLIRYLRRKGYRANFRIHSDPVSAIRYPSVLGVKMKNYGHFIPAIPEGNDHIVLGDPLVGRETYLREGLKKKYKFTGWSLEVRRDHQ